ncbi:MAG: sigma-70 family RNA polymerase sigma factor [Alphaproteobacteria bacterium]
MTNNPDQNQNAIDTISDEDLMIRIQAHDHQAFAALVRRHSSMFYGCAFRVCGRQEEAEDAVQDAFLKLWNNPKIWQPDRGAKFTTWFYRVVVNAATDRLRKNKRYSPTDSAPLEAMPDHTAAQDEQLIASDEQQALEEAIQTLPERQKLALNLCFYEGLSNKEAAETLGVGVKALESLLMRAKSGLKQALIAKGLVDEERKYG